MNKHTLRIANILFLLLLSVGTSAAQLLCSKPKEGMKEGVQDGHKWIDLGLPSGTKWAACNVGASYPWSKGTYSEYADWSFATGQYIDELAWHGFWRRPLKEEFAELIDNCEWEWTTMNGTNGYKVTGKNGASIFLPAAGTNESNADNTFGCYWALDEYYEKGSKVGAYALIFDKNKKVVSPLRTQSKTITSSIRLVVDEFKLF